jgi:hypothetical protein
MSSNQTEIVGRRLVSRQARLTIKRLRHDSNCGFTNQKNLLDARSPDYDDAYQKWLLGYEDLQISLVGGG